MFYVIMTPLVISAILSVIWCIRPMKDNPSRAHKYKTPKIERVDSSFENEENVRYLDCLYRRLTRCGITEYSIDHIAKCICKFEQKDKDNISRIVLYNSLLTVELFNKFKMSSNTFVLLLKLSEIDNSLNRNFFEDDLIRRNKSNLKNFVQYVGTGYGHEGWTLKQCYTKKYEAYVLNKI